MDLYYGIISPNYTTELYYGLILPKYISELYSRTILQNGIMEVYHGVILQNCITELQNYGIILPKYMIESYYGTMLRPQTWPYLCKVTAPEAVDLGIRILLLQRIGPAFLQRARGPSRQPSGPSWGVHRQLARPLWERCIIWEGGPRWEDGPRHR